MFNTTVTQKGQVTIPSAIRKMTGIQSQQRVTVTTDGENVVIKPAIDFFSLRGSLKTNIKYDKKKARDAIGKYLGERHNAKNS